MAYRGKRRLSRLQLGGIFILAGFLSFSLSPAASGRERDRAKAAGSAAGAALIVAVGIGLMVSHAVGGRRG